MSLTWFSAVESKLGIKSCYLLLLKNDCLATDLHLCSLSSISTLTLSKNRRSTRTLQPAIQRAFQTTFPPLSPASNRRSSRNLTCEEVPLGSSTSLQNVMPLEVVKNSFCRKLAMVFRKRCMKKISIAFIEKEKKRNHAWNKRRQYRYKKTAGPIVRKKVELGGRMCGAGVG